MGEILTTVYLPSRGRLNLDEPAYAGPIEMDMIGFEEEKMMFGSNSENVLDRMLDSVIKTEGIKASELCPQDRHFLLVKERIHSYGENYHLTDVCPSCGNMEEYKIDMNDVPVIELPEDFAEPIEGKLPLSGHTIGIKILRNRDNKSINAEINTKVDKLHLSAKDLRYELRKVRSIVTIDGEQPKLGEREKFIRGLKGRDLAYIDYLMEKTKFGYSNTVLVTCKSCGHQFEVPFVMSGEFFRPRFD